MTLPSARDLRHVRAVVPIVFPSREAEAERATQSARHQRICAALYDILRAASGREHTVAADAIVYFDAVDPQRCVVPDATVKLGVIQHAFESWKTWVRGAPELAFEVLAKDSPERFPLEDKLDRYRALAVSELVVFEVDAEAGSRLRVWDRIDGDLVERVVEREQTPCLTLGVFLRIAPVNDLPACVRLSGDPEGAQLFPTASEAWSSETEARQTAEAARQTAEVARLRAEAAGKVAELAREAAEEKLLQAQRGPRPNAFGPHSNMGDFSVFTRGERALLEALNRHSVRFLLVGLSAAVLQGANTATRDIDTWFEDLGDPRFNQAIREAAGIWISSQFGARPPQIGADAIGDRVDVVTHIDGLRPFVDEYKRAITMEIDAIPLRVLPLERVIASKRASKRSRDLVAIPALEEALATIRKKAEAGA